MQNSVVANIRGYVFDNSSAPPVAPMGTCTHAWLPTVGHWLHIPAGLMVPLPILFLPAATPKPAASGASKASPASAGSSSKASPGSSAARPAGPSAKGITKARAHTQMHTCAPSPPPPRCAATEPPPHPLLPLLLLPAPPQGMAGMALGPKRERLHLTGLARKNLTMLKELGVGMTGAVYLCKVQTSERSSMIAVVKARRTPAPA